MTRNCFGDLGGARSCWGYRLKVVRNKQEIENALPINTTYFTLKSLQKATNNFSNGIGSGGFSSCYKGTLDNGTVVAVKVFRDGKGDGDQIRMKNSEFVSLVKMMSRFRHRNVVELIGCCVEDDQKIMVYEFMGNNSLDRWLFNGNGKRTELSWQTRMSICIGVAHGLEYLHHGISPCVVHRDIKASNVLLDDNFNPKIADLDVAHPIDDNLSHYSGPVAGTYGYIDPEYCMKGRITVKADVYSFGILLLEVISGRNVALFLREGTGTSLVNWVWELRESDRVMEVVDPTLAECPADEVIRFIDVALYCVQESSDLRPSMSEVLLMLSGGYEFSQKVLRNPVQSSWSSTSHKVNNPVHDERSGEMEITAAGNDAVPPMNEYGRSQQSISARESLHKALRDRDTATEGKMTRDIFEIESNVETDSSEEELVQMSNDLEIELYTSIEPTISVKFSESRPSDKTVMKPEMISTSSETNVLAQNKADEGAAHVQTSHELQADLDRSTEPDISDAVTIFGPSLETSVDPEMMMATSAQTRTFSHNEEFEGLSFAEVRHQDVVLPLTKVIDVIILSNVDKILETLTDGQSTRICLYGRGGSGKTTVLEILFQHPAAKLLFEQVIFVTVPRLAHRQKIQNKIVQQLSLNVQNCNSEDEIADLIRFALASRKVLLLLDDVWEMIDLHEIGIPNLGPENSCWLVFATRSLDVCHLMADKEIKMRVLSTMEAWELFHYQAGSIIDSPIIEPYARAICDECHGVPSIISAVGSALRGESSVVEWKLAAQSFQFSDKSNAQNMFSLSPQIKYCYDRLKAHDVKICFLYCALFARDKEIEISMLVDCFINEGLLGGRTVAAYRKGLDIVEHLVNSALLEASENGRMVKMHKVIRDSALAILSGIEGYHVLVGSYLSPSLVLESEQDVQSFGESGSAAKLVDGQDSSSIPSPFIHIYLTGIGSQLKELPSIEEWEQASLVCLINTGLASLPSNPCCANLVALCLQRNSCIRVIPDSFFDSMSTLKILNLSQTRIKSLPDSISKLKSLQVLLLRDCERMLMLPSSIGLLKSLEVLDLQRTELSHLPDTVGELASLKRLQVSFYASSNHNEYKKLPTKLIPHGTISRLELRELGIFVHPGDPRWTPSALDIIKEVKKLKLTTLYFQFPKVEYLKYFLDGNQSTVTECLRTFNFTVGSDFKHAVSQVSCDAELMYSEEERCLRFVNGENIPDAVMEILTRATSFYLDHHLSIRDLSEFGIDRMQDLKLCILRDCPHLKAVVDVKEHHIIVFRSLEYLSINHLWNLKRIWVGHALVGSLARLRYLSVHGCPKLRYVLTRPMLEMLCNLEELVIEDCESLEYIVIEDEKVMGDDGTKKFVERTDLILASPVLYSLKVLKLLYLPELCNLWRGRWPPLEYISFYSCPKLKNLHMEANDGMNIKEITADKAWWDLLDWDNSVVSRRLDERFIQIHIDDL